MDSRANPAWLHRIDVPLLRSRVLVIVLTPDGDTLMRVRTEAFNADPARYVTPKVAFPIGDVMEIAGGGQVQLERPPVVITMFGGQVWVHYDSRTTGAPAPAPPSSAALRSISRRT
jgi:hypothetical protein